MRVSGGGNTRDHHLEQCWLMMSSFQYFLQPYLMLRQLCGICQQYGVLFLMYLCVGHQVSFELILMPMIIFQYYFSRRSMKPPS